MCKAQESHEVHTDYAHNLIRMKARQLVRRPEFRPYDPREIEQDLWVHLLSRAQHFDPTRGSINAFVACVVGSGVAMLVRRRKRRIRMLAPDAGALSLDIGTVDNEGQPVPFSETISSADVDRRTGGVSRPDLEVRVDHEAFAQARQSMSPLEQQVCDHLAAGTPTSTARDLGLSRRKLRATVAVIRAHFSARRFWRNLIYGGQVSRGRHR